MQFTNNLTALRNLAVICSWIGLSHLGVTGCTSETVEDPTDSEADERFLDQPAALGKGTLTIGAMQYDLAVDQCALKSTFADGRGRLYSTIHGLTAGDPFVISMRFDENSTNEHIASLLDFSTEEPWSWITIDIDKERRDQTRFSVTLNEVPFSLATGTDGELVPKDGLSPVDAGLARLSAVTFARLDVGEPLEKVRLDLESRCSIHWGF